MAPSPRCCAGCDARGWRVSREPRPAHRLHRGRRRGARQEPEPFRVAASEAVPRLTAGEVLRCTREDLEGAAWCAVGVDRSGGDHQHPGIVHLGFTSGAASDLTADAVRAAEPTGGGGDPLAADSVPDVLSERRMDGEQGNSRLPRSRGRRQVLGALPPSISGRAVRCAEDTTAIRAWMRRPSCVSTPWARPWLTMRRQPSRP